MSSISKHPTKTKKNNPVHFDNIDVLKAFSAFLVILIHVLARYKTDQGMEQFWIWSHFSVGAFVIASGFLQAIKPLNTESFPKTVLWFWKRVVRLLGPYYVYLIIHIVMTLLLPETFNRQHVSLSLESVRDTLLLHGGFASNWVWIPRIFILMTGMYVINVYLFRKLKSNWAYYVPFTASLLVSFLFFFKRPDFSIKYIQAVTWYSLFLFGFLMYRWWKDKKFRGVILAVSGILTTILGAVLMLQGRSTNVFVHKYPPTLYFLSYNIFAVLAVFSIAPEKLKGASQKVIRFISRYSYEIFFAQVIVLDGLGQISDVWWIDYLATALTTIGVVAVWYLVTKKVSDILLKKS